MGSPMTCPVCGFAYPIGAQVCSCGQTLSRVPSGRSASPPDKPAPIKIERPFDIGKPLGTKFPVSPVCPSCGAAEHEKVKPETMVAFAKDRVCRICATRYTPPTPIWGRVLFGIIGLAAIAFGVLIIYEDLVLGRKAGGFLGLIPYLVSIVVGVGCLYKAATK